MTDKTIINGIDVSNCEYLSPLNNGINACIAGKRQVLKYRVCECNHNCYFKQLARAKEEIEKWKHQAELGSDTADRLSKELEDKNQEIEKLKSQIENEKQALQIDIDNLNHACLDLSQENEELKHQIEDVDTLCSEKESLIDKYVQTIEAATQLAPFQDEYFKGLDTKAIAELAKKSQRLTSENRELEQKNEELKAQVDEWKENCNNNFELVAIRTKLLTDIAIKLGLNTAIIERKDVFDKIDKLQSKEQLSLKQSQVIITLRNNLNVNKQKNANLLQEREELKKATMTLAEGLNFQQERADKLAQECEELKKQYNCYACDTCKGKEDYRNLKRHCENAIRALHNKQAELDQLKAKDGE